MSDLERINSSQQLPNIVVKLKCDNPLMYNHPDLLGAKAEYVGDKCSGAIFFLMFNILIVLKISNMIQKLGAAIYWALALDKMA